MPIVQSFGELQSFAGSGVPSWQGGGGGSVHLYDSALSYATLWATQPNIRTCVDFLARNVAQLRLHAYRRRDDTDRERLSGHDLVRWLSHPNPSMTRYRLFEALVSDLGIYFDTFWLKIRTRARDGRPEIGLVRLPPEECVALGGLVTTGFRWTVNGRAQEFAPSEIVHIHGFNPKDSKRGLSPLDTLRNVLAEEAAAGRHREAYWSNASRMEGLIEQGAAAPNWTEPQQAEFRKQWQEYSAGGSKVGMTAVLPKGMTYKQNSFSPHDSEYTAGRKLTREECAAAYHIPLPLVGILEHATFSNIVEQHKHLYQDCLGPTLQMIVEELTAQLLIECVDQADVYLEFNIADKLKGSFEEQAASLALMVGRPLMTANEGRARLNLPRIVSDDADGLAAQQGGPAATGPRIAGAPDTSRATVVDVTPALAAVRTRQLEGLRRLPAADRPAAFASQARRWNRELEATLLPLVQSADDARRLAADANLETLTRLRDEASQ